MVFGPRTPWGPLSHRQAEKGPSDGRGNRGSRGTRRGAEVALPNLRASPAPIGALPPLPTPGADMPMGDCRVSVGWGKKRARWPKVPSVGGWGLPLALPALSSPS